MCWGPRALIHDFGSQTKARYSTFDVVCSTRRLAPLVKVQKRGEKGVKTTTESSLWLEHTRHRKSRHCRQGYIMRVFGVDNDKRN